jgi:hypothetical protein
MPRLQAIGRVKVDQLAGMVWLTSRMAAQTADVNAGDVKRSPW